MKNKLLFVVFLLVISVIAFGYISEPAPKQNPIDPNAPMVIGSKTAYLGNNFIFEIDVEDSNDDTLEVIAENGTVTKLSTVYMGDMTISDANGTCILAIQKTTYQVKFRPVAKGLFYPQITVTDSCGAEDVEYVELDVRVKNVKPIITGCR